MVGVSDVEGEDRLFVPSTGRPSRNLSVVTMSWCWSYTDWSIVRSRTVSGSRGAT
jgi:hypothetical protein